MENKMATALTIIGTFVALLVAGLLFASCSKSPIIDNGELEEIKDELAEVPKCILTAQVFDGLSGKLVFEGKLDEWFLSGKPVSGNEYIISLDGLSGKPDCHIKTIIQIIN